MQTVVACKAAPAAGSIVRSSSRPQRGFKAFTPAVTLRRSAAAAGTRRQLSVVAAAAAADAPYPSWEAIHAELTRAKVESLSPEDAFDMAELGKAVVIDVRPKEDHEQAHPKGAVHVPAFLVIESPSSPGEFGKWLACKANGVTPTKNNPELAAKVAAAAADGKAVILACEAGGTLQPSVNFPAGKVSRSLKAAWKVLASNSLPAERVKHLDGGVYRWNAAGLPMTGEYDGSNAGKTPNVAEKPSGVYIDGR